MDDQEKPSFKPYLPAFLMMIIIGWGGVTSLVLFTLPAVWQRWAFFLFLALALTGVALPIAYYLNLRFPGKSVAGPNIILRQSLWLGVFGCTISWLQLGDIVSIWTIILIGAGLSAIEYFLRLRERSRWQPPLVPEEPPTQIVG